jgi:hypothetical protein
MQKRLLKFENKDAQQHVLKQIERKDLFSLTPQICIEE